MPKVEQVELRSASRKRGKVAVISREIGQRSAFMSLDKMISRYRLNIDDLARISFLFKRNHESMEGKWGYITTKYKFLQIIDHIHRALTEHRDIICNEIRKQVLMLWYHLAWNKKPNQKYNIILYSYSFRAFLAALASCFAFFFSSFRRALLSSSPSSEILSAVSSASEIFRFLPFSSCWSARV